MSRSSSSSGSTESMGVLLSRGGKTDLKDRGDSWDVDSSSGHVRGEENTTSCELELVGGFGSLRLGFTTEMSMEEGRGRISFAVAKNEG